ncbi:uncharacterized protein K441DRAFT_421922, partial [Cenococcum geophilum 1.58]|uniref:uncharacterized protein n=1 Tax=Cenococcum geophilum 1.58 TaxID=794803 RepID=UPI00358EC644
TLLTIYKSFKDYSSIYKLLIIGLYNKYWCDLKSLLLKYTAIVYLGFIPSNKVNY